MGGFTSGGGGGPGGIPGPDVPIPDFVSQAKQQAEGLKQAGLWGNFWAVFWGYAVQGSQIVISSVMSLVDAFLSDVVSFFTLAQGTNTTGFFALIGALIGDLLGVEVNAQTIADTFHTRGQLASVRAVGSTVIDQLMAEFGGDSPKTPEQGYAAAQAFMGFLIEFAVRQGNVSFLQSLFPFEWLEGIREYGEVMAQNLGLGRMARRAFQPLIQVSITDPFQQYLNAKYRPKLLGSSLAARAFNRGLIDQPTLSNEFAWDGYNDARATAIQQESLTQLAAAEAYVLQRWGLITPDAARQLILRFGYDAASADKFLAAEAAKRADTEIQTFLGILRTQRVQGFIDSTTFRSIVDTLPLDQPLKDFYLQTVGQQVEFPRKNLTLAEAQAAFVSGFLDLSDFDDFLSQQGYDPIAHQVLVLQTLEKLATEEAKTAVAQYAYNLKVAKAVAKGQIVPPIPPGLQKAPAAP